MNMRSSRSMVTFSNAFNLSGYVGHLPAGDYEITVEEELLQGLSFEAYRRTATYLKVLGKGSNAGRAEMRRITERDLELALSHDHAITENTDNSEAALSPLEDLE